jgi:hypothetical protein
MIDSHDKTRLNKTDAGSKHPASEIHALRNLGPKSAQWLADVGIATRSQLAQIGAIGACRLLLHAGLPVTRNLAYAIVGALMDCNWRTIPFEFRKQLVLEFNSLRQEARHA